MFIAVEFNIAEMIEYFMAPRFSQPWQRGNSAIGKRSSSSSACSFTSSRRSLE
jgi:hypothetical protein